MPHDVFISYSSHDKPVADATSATLEGLGIRCWIAPRDILPGMDWGESIIDAINSTRVLVLIFSGNANESPQVKREIERAVNRSIPIIPVRTENVMPSKSLEYFISSAHWLDAMTPPLAEHLNRLASTIQILLNRTAATPEPRPATSKSVTHASKESSVEDFAGSIFLAPQKDEVANDAAPFVPTTSPHPQFAELLVRIPAGEFLMGSVAPDSRAAANEKPQHSVRITNSFLLARIPVTELLFWQIVGDEEFARVRDLNPTRWGRDELNPVTYIPLTEVVNFCNRLSQLEGIAEYYSIDAVNRSLQVNGGIGYRLPTEAEWEYACRAGSSATWCCGDSESGLAEYAWFNANAENRVHSVGTKKPNSWGLHDMHGNVNEWCGDLFSEFKFERPGVKQRTDPTGPRPGTTPARQYVFRGGCCFDQAENLRSAKRNWVAATPALGTFIGFRVARTLEER